MNQTRRIAFTGGGTAGHVNPNLAIIERCRRAGDLAWLYLGTPDGIERELVEREGDITYHAVPSERLRRYATWKNLLTPFKVLQGIWVAYWTLRRERPDVLFSKGGFAAFPVVVGAWLNRLPVIAHESDITPGLANKLSFPFVRTICTGFHETVKLLGEDKAVYTGSPIRKAFFEADIEAANDRFGLDPKRPVVVVFGGSQGAQHINEVVRERVDDLLERAQVVHACGAGHHDPSLEGKEGYSQHEYIYEGFPDLMARAEVVICRAGANSLAELLALGTPGLLIPLPTASSRGDQLVNARDYVKQGFGEMIRDEELEGDALVTTLDAMLEDLQGYRDAIAERGSQDSAEVILGMLREA